MKHYAGAILYDGKRVLLGKRANHRARFPGVWDIFGGHVEPGEEPLDAIKRELREELGIMVRTATLVGVVSGHDGDDTMPYTLSVFLVRKWARPFRLHRHEHDDMRWFYPTDLDELLSVIDPRLPGFIQQTIAEHQSGAMDLT